EACAVAILSATASCTDTSPSVNRPPASVPSASASSSTSGPSGLGPALPTADVPAAEPSGDPAMGLAPIELGEVPTCRPQEGPSVVPLERLKPEASCKTPEVEAHCENGFCR